MDISTLTVSATVNRIDEKKVQGRLVFFLKVSCQTTDTEDGIITMEIPCWKKGMDQVAATLRRGDKIVASGKLQKSEWTPKSGGTRIELRLVADSIQKVDNEYSSNSDGTAESNAEDTSPPPPPPKRKRRVEGVLPEDKPDEPPGYENSTDEDEIPF